MATSLGPTAQGRWWQTKSRGICQKSEGVRSEGSNPSARNDFFLLKSFCLSALVESWPVNIVRCTVRVRCNIYSITCYICERFTCSWINKAAWGRTSFKKRRLSALCSQNSTLDPVRKRRLLSTNLLSLCSLNKKARAWFRLKNIRRVPPPGFFPTRWETSNWATVDFYWL